ncbi:MAG: DUF1836 domain-containing protein [Clostridiaceae bacterium]|nr:DUF1836 domain-containing protein [Clostridiaceae bacterium]
MAEQIDWLDQWLTELDGKHPADWALLPDIGLYMDQVQTFIDRQLGLYRRDDHERLLTPAMINNYIKDNLIPRAESKKYAPTHLALLIIIGTLKQVLSIQNLNQLLSSYRDPADVAALYQHFLEVQRFSLRENAAQVLAETAQLRQEIPAEGEPQADHATALRNLALELSIEARTRILIAERILTLLDQEKAGETSEKNERKKDKGK